MVGRCLPVKKTATVILAVCYSSFLSQCPSVLSSSTPTKVSVTTTSSSTPMPKSKFSLQMHHSKSFPFTSTSIHAHFTPAFAFVGNRYRSGRSGSSLIKKTRTIAARLYFSLNYPIYTFSSNVNNGNRIPTNSIFLDRVSFGSKATKNDHNSGIESKNAIEYVNESDDFSSYATTYHAPVMARECIEAMLQTSKSKKKNKDKNIDDEERGPLILVDGTLGGGGHSQALLEKMKPGDILIGCDVDPDALATASERLKDYLSPSLPLPESKALPPRPIFIPVQSNFRNLHKIIPQIKHPYLPNTLLFHNTTNESINPNIGIDAILLDLGVSSFQIDNPSRGFAFLKDGPLDMRMSSNSNVGTLTAADICNEFDEHDLVRILRQYGDESRAKSIVRSIIQNRPLHTTLDLRNAVAQVTPEFSKKGRRLGRMATLARVFQALRIVVNEEDLALKEALEVMASRLVNKVGGRLVVLSYHSMEDGMVKRVMKDGSVEKRRGMRHEEKDIYGNYIGVGKPWKMLGKGRKASKEEVETNSRARSATLRIGERLFQNDT